MPVTVRPYELLARFDRDGNVAGVSVRRITTVDGREYESDPQPLAGTSDPAFSAFAEQFGAAAVAERDQLTAQVAAITAELSAAASQVETLAAERDQLQEQLDALLNPPVNPRHVAPFVFLSLLKPEEIVAMQTSNDPIVLIGRAKLQTIITYIDLDNLETQQLVGYMEQSGLIAMGRAARILSNQPPE